MQKRDFETYQKRFRDFEILPKFSETHVFRGTIRHPYKSHRSFCFEAFEHLMYPNTVTHKTRSGFTDECKSVKSRNFFRFIMFLNRARFPCRTTNNLHVSL